MKKYLDLNTIAKMRPFELKVQTVVDGFLVGIHKSPHHGFSQEFVEHRQYFPGDEPRYIDWKVYGKTDRLYLKQFEEERNLRAYIMLDGSSSMRYKNKGSMKKWDYASIIAASFAYLLTLNKDAVSLAVFDTAIREYLAPSTTKAGITRITDTIERSHPEGKTKIGGAIEGLSGKVKRRAFVLILSDLLDARRNVTRSIVNLSAKGNEIVVIQVLDPSETEFSYKGSIRLYDMETKKEILINGDSIRDKYKENMDKFLSGIKGELQRNNINYIRVDTNTPIEKVLYYIFRREVVK